LRSSFGQFPLAKESGVSRHLERLRAVGAAMAASAIDNTHALKARLPTPAIADRDGLGIIVRAVFFFNLRPGQTSESTGRQRTQRRR